MNKNAPTFKWQKFILGLSFFLLAIITYSNPSGDFTSFSIVIGLIITIKGLFEVIFGGIIYANVGAKVRFLYFFGFWDIVFGLIILFNIPSISNLLPYVFSAWFILNSIYGLINIRNAKLFGNIYFYLNCVLNILSLVIGVALLFFSYYSPIIFSFLVSTYFLFLGIANLADSFV